MIEIQVTDSEKTGETEQVTTTGYLLLYLEGDKIQMQGKMDIASLTPIMTKVFMKKFMG